MKMTRNLVLLALVFVVSACNFHKFDEVKAVNEATAVGNPFTQALTNGYKDLVQTELDNYDDHADALHYSRKGIAAARGDMVMPEQVSDWNLNAGHIADLTNARSRLVAVYALGAREIQPDLAAYAQVRFDCWIEEQEENFQQDNISSCKSQFMDAVSRLEAAMPAPPPPAPAPVADAFDVDPSQPMELENAKYIVFFDWDEHSLNPGAQSIVDAAAEEAKSRSLVSVDLVGHTDTSGSQAYNQKLSMKRANIVRDALTQRGVNPSLMQLNHRGENELLVDTADGVREPANRRTEITFQ